MANREPVLLGPSGLTAAPLGWGMWRFRGDDLAAARARVDAALAIGCTLFDTADIYGPDNGEPFGAAEALLGRLLAEDPALRARMIVATKGGIAPPAPYDSSAAYLIEACEASLRRLRTDVIDLYQIHRPDLLAHPAEVAAALDRLRAAGKIKAAGVSNYTAAQTRALMAHLPFPLAAVQPEFSPLAPGPLEDGVLDLAMEAGLGVLAWSPLGQGRLGGAGGDDRSRRVIAALDAIGARSGVTRTAIAYAWVLAHPSRPIALIGTQTPARIREAAQAYDVSLSREDWYAILVAARGAPMP
jgi:aryl-alcohol dehydrogenase-like predicted oxidoreductase